MTRSLVGLTAACFVFLFAAVALPLSLERIPESEPLRERVRKADVIVLGTTRFVLPRLLTGEAGPIVGLEVDSVLAKTARGRRGDALARGRVIRIRPDEEHPGASALVMGQWIWFLRSSGDSTFHTLRAVPIQAPRVSREATVLIDSLVEWRRGSAPVLDAFEAYLLGEESSLPSGRVQIMNIAPDGK